MTGHAICSTSTTISTPRPVEGVPTSVGTFPSLPAPTFVRPTCTSTSTTVPTSTSPGAPLASTGAHAWGAFVFGLVLLAAGITMMISGRAKGGHQ